MLSSISHCSHKKTFCLWLARSKLLTHFSKTTAFQATIFQRKFSHHDHLYTTVGMFKSVNISIFSLTNVVQTHFNWPSSTPIVDAISERYPQILPLCLRLFRQTVSLNVLLLGKYDKNLECGGVLLYGVQWDNYSIRRGLNSITS